MSNLFIWLLVLFCLLALLGLWKRLFQNISFIVGVILIVLAKKYVVLFQNHFFWWVLIGFVLGEIALSLSLSLIKLSIRQAFGLFFLRIGSFFKYYLSRTDVVLKYLIVSTYEEVLWRGTVQYLLGAYLGEWAWAIFLTSVIFALVHQYKEEVYLLEAFELFLFSCLVGWLFVRYGSIYFVIMIHAVRNINISCLKESFRKERLHDIHPGSH